MTKRGFDRITAKSTPVARSKMGSFNGHALPGSLFLFLGIWWLIHSVLEYAAGLNDDAGNSRGQSSKRSPWRRVPSKRLRNIPFEPFVKVLGGLVGIIAELAPEHFELVDKDNEFVNANNFAHSSMYGFFALSGLVEILNLYKVIQLSAEAEYTILALAFGVEGTLFAFHLHGRDMFDVRIHTLLYIIIYLAALVILLEACLPKFRRELFMARTVFVLTQGSWFWEIAYTLYGQNNWVSNAARDLTRNQLMLDTEVITFGIMWHLLAWCVLVLLCCIVTSCFYKRQMLPNCCSNYGKAQLSSSRLNGTFLREHLSLPDEEVILLKRDSQGNNNMSSELHSINIDEEA